MLVFAFPKPSTMASVQPPPGLKKTCSRAVVAGAGAMAALGRGATGAAGTPYESVPTVVANRAAAARARAKRLRMDFLRQGTSVLDVSAGDDRLQNERTAWRVTPEPRNCGSCHLEQIRRPRRKGLVG